MGGIVGIVDLGGDKELEIGEGFEVEVSLAGGETMFDVPLRA